MDNADQVHEGLEGIAVARTRLSDVDGEGGRLIIAGNDVERLAVSASFEDLCGILWETDPSGVRDALAEGRGAAFECVPRLGTALALSDPMDSLRACVATLGAQFDSPEMLSGAIPVLTAAHARLQRHEKPIAPVYSSSHASDYLAMHGIEDATGAFAKAIASYLVTVSDHGMNASTFTARVVASTGSDLVSSVVAAIGALKGPLHGGAPGPVLDMLDQVGSAERATAWLEGELTAGRRIMGMGHRIYRVRDPRAAVLEEAIQRLEASGKVDVSRSRLALARGVEQAARGALAQRHPTRPLHANVEFYTAVLLDTIGIPRTHFSSTFAVGRVAGWCAHVAEQRTTGRLIRPASVYTGPIPNMRIKNC